MIGVRELLRKSPSFPDQIELDNQVSLESSLFSRCKKPRFWTIGIKLFCAIQVFVPGKNGSRARRAIWPIQVSFFSLFFDVRWFDGKSYAFWHI